MAKKSTVKKTIRKAPTKKVAVRKSAPKKTVSKKAAPKKAATKKTAPKKSAAPKKAKPKKANAKSIEKPVTKPSKPKKRCSKALPIIGLLINILFAPGLGTLIAGGKKKVTNGLIQLILSIVAWALIFTTVGMIVGGPLLFAMWVWSIVDMAKVIGEK